jgi:hypothetical protein
LKLLVEIQTTMQKQFEKGWKIHNFPIGHFVTNWEIEAKMEDKRKDGQTNLKSRSRPKRHYPWPIQVVTGNKTISR